MPRFAYDVFEIAGIRLVIGRTRLRGENGRLTMVCQNGRFQFSCDWLSFANECKSALCIGELPARNHQS